MRIWDINPGYLNRQSLLGEHRELHGIISIIVNKRKGYSKHPETLRWVGYGWALKMRHQLLAAEMALRGYSDKSPVTTRANKGEWPKTYIDEPIDQLKILKTKYQDKSPGRIPLPENAQQLWRQHKYSVLARSPLLYKQLGKAVSAMKSNDDFSEIAKIVTEQLKQAPTIGGLRNAMQHMWGYVSAQDTLKKGEIESWPIAKLMKEIQHRAMTNQTPYLITSTALSELIVWASTG